MKKFFTLGFMMLIASVMFGQDLHTIDFEFDGVGADWTWDYCCNGAEASVVEIVDNPSYTEPNVSDKVGTYTCKADGDAWALFINKVDVGEFTLTAENCIMSIMVYKAITSDIAMKLEDVDGNSQTIVHSNTVTDAWEEVTFDFTEFIGESFSRVGFMPSNIARSEDVVIYFDNIQIPEGVVAVEEVDTDGDGTLDDVDPDDDNDGNLDDTDSNPLVATTVADILSVTQGTSGTVNVLANDDFIPGDKISLVDAGTGTATGIILLDGTTGELTYTPADGEDGTNVTVVYTVCNTDAIPNVCQDGTVTITVGTATVVANITHTIDFEFDGVGADWTWGVNCNDDNAPLEIVDNPDYTEPNVSDKVAKFTAKAAGDAWALMVNESDNGEFTFDADNCIVKMMVYKSVATDIGFKFENIDAGTEVTVVQANTLVNQWEEVTFDFTENIGETYKGIVIMPSNIARTEDVIVYMDNIQLPEGVSLISSVADIAAATELVLFPNPVSDLVNISNVQDGELLKVYNVTGALVKSIAVNNGVVSLGDLVKGQYFVRVNGLTSKIIKK